MGQRRSRAWLLLAVLCGACTIEHRLVPCGDQSCPVGLVCTPGGCATSEAAAACVGQDNGAACTSVSIEAGTCTDGACRPVACGNGVVDAGEACDDGNTSYDDNCSADCRSTQVCGNAIPDYIKGEECDSSIGGLSTDGCSSQCTDEIELWRDRSPADIGAVNDGAMVCDPFRGVAFRFGGFASAFSNESFEWTGRAWRRLPLHVRPGGRTAPTMAFDRDRRRAVLFGGEGLFGVRFGDTWEYDGVAWTERSPVTQPSARSGHGMAYDPVRRRVVMFGGRTATDYLGDTWEWDGVDWSRRATTGPSARHYAALAWDPTTSTVLLYGGISSSTGTAAMDVWAWNGTSWQQRSSSTPPGPRMGAHLASDSTRVVIFGGFISPTGNGPSDTWSWNGSVWQPVSGAALPPTARMTGGFCYEAMRGRFVLFGGTNGSVASSDTWELSGSTWQNVSPVARPPARNDHGLAYDARRGRVVLFGGRDRSTYRGDTWEWDGHNWIDVSPTGASPSARAGLGLAYHEQVGAVVLFGGGDSMALNDLWRWDGTVWTPISTAQPRPPPRAGHSFAYDRDRNRLVVFGGATLSGSATYEDTWELDLASATWSLRTPPAHPSPRVDATLAYDPYRKRSVLVGGTRAVGVPFEDAWEWDGTTWTGIPWDALQGRTRIGLSYEPLRHVVVGFGGNGFFGSAQSDTLEIDGSVVVVRAPPLSPPRRGGAPLAFDAIHQRTLVFGGGDTSALQDTWTRAFESAPHPSEHCVDAAADTDGDGHAGCADPDCYGRCAPLCPPHLSCDPAAPRCGDGACGAVEDFRICPTDCTAPPP